MKWHRDAYLAGLLRRELPVTNVFAKAFKPGPAIGDEVVPTNRIILVRRGELEYTMDRETFRLAAGTQFFVPAWVRRVWTVARRGPGEIIWCEFDDDPIETAPRGCHRRQLAPAELRRENSHYNELRRAYEADSPASRLLAEGLLKAMLSRFWMEALAPERPPGRRRTKPPHPAVREALRWLHGHYCEPGVIDSLYRVNTVTPNYLRRHFQAALRCTPQRYVQQLRLRQARYLLHETDWQQKRIAAEVGYPDPLYFSRLYHRFWGHAPTAEREA